MGEPMNDKMLDTIRFDTNLRKCETIEMNRSRQLIQNPGKYYFDAVRIDHDRLTFVCRMKKRNERLRAQRRTQIIHNYVSFVYCSVGCCSTQNETRIQR